MSRQAELPASGWRLLSVPASVALAIALTSGFVVVVGVNVPFWDEWDFPALLQKADAGTLRWADLAQQHNEHRILVPRLVMLGLARLTSWNVKAQMLFTVLHLSLLLLVVCAQAARDYRFSWRRAPAWLVWIPLLVLNWRQYENLTWGFQIAPTLPLTASTIAFFLLLRTAEGAAVPRRTAAFIGAILAAVAASFSGPMGLLAWPLGVGLLLVAPWRSGRRALAATAWGGAGAVTVSLYFHDYQSPPHHAGIVGASAVQVGQFFLSVLGAAGSTRPDVTLATGVLLLAAIGGAVLVLARRSLLRRRLFWLASSLMSLGTLAMVAWGRAGSPELATRSAYTTYSLFAVASTLPLVVEALRSSPGTRRVTAATALGSLVLGLGVANGFAIGLTTASANRVPLLHLRDALRDYCNRPNGDLAPLYENVALIRSGARYLERRRYSVFAGQPDATCRIRESEPLPAYGLGTVISFGAGGDARLFQGSGWSFPEEGFTWTDGPRAELRLLLAPPVRDATLVLTVPIAHTDPGRLARQRVVVSLNAARIGTVLVPGAGHYVLAVPGRLWREGENILAFDLPDAWSPPTGGRRLGIALHSMQIR